MLNIHRFDAVYVDMISNEHLRLEIVSDQGVVFSQADQKVFRLDPVSTFVWCCLDEGYSIDEAASALSERSDLDISAALEHIKQVLRQRDAMVGDPDERSSPPIGMPARDFSPITTQQISIGDRSFHLTYEDAATADTVGALFAHAAVHSNQPSFVVSIHGRGPYAIAINGMIDEICDQLHLLAPLVKASVAKGILTQTSYSLGIHAAAVLRKGKALLMPGHSGQGKSTLALALARHGYDYLCDDTALLDIDRNEVRGLYFCPAVKDSAWSIIEPMYPHIRCLPTYLRPDNKLVRYLPPPVDQSVVQCSHSIGNIVIPQWRPHGGSELTAVAHLDVLILILQEAYKPSQMLTVSDFSSIVHWLVSRPCYQLIYSDTNAAIAALDELC